METLTTFSKEWSLIKRQASWLLMDFRLASFTIGMAICKITTQLTNVGKLDKFCNAAGP